MNQNLEESKLSLRLNGLKKIEKDVMQISENDMQIEPCNKSKNDNSNLR